MSEPEWGGAQSIWLMHEGQLKFVPGNSMMTKVTALSMALVPNMGFPKLYQVSVSVDFH